MSKKPSIITASMICRQALLSFSQLRNGECPPSDVPFPNLGAPVFMPGQFGVAFGIPDEALIGTLDGLTHHYIEPAVTVLSRLAGDAELGFEHLVKPLGVWAVASEIYNGVCLRCVIVEDFAVDEVWPWSKRIRKYYDVSADEYKTGPTTMAVRFDVHEPGMGRLAEAA
jgi:hypothetical protein